MSCGSNAANERARPCGPGYPRRLCAGPFQVMVWPCSSNNTGTTMSSTAGIRDQTTPHTTLRSVVDASRTANNPRSKLTPDEPDEHPYNRVCGEQEIVEPYGDYNKPPTSATALLIDLRGQRQSGHTDHLLESLANKAIGEPSVTNRIGQTDPLGRSVDGLVPLGIPHGRVRAPRSGHSPSLHARDAGPGGVLKRQRPTFSMGLPLPGAARCGANCNYRAMRLPFAFSPGGLPKPNVLRRTRVTGQHVARSRIVRLGRYCCDRSPRSDASDRDA